MKMPARLFLRPLLLLSLLSAIGCTGPSTLASAWSPPSAAPSELDGLLQSMQAAVLAGDRDGYLALVDPSDPVFALEHARWADDWAGPNPVAEYSLQLADVEITGEAATGELAVRWALEADNTLRTASFAARFTHGSGRWLYAGEAWDSTEVEHFSVLVAPGLGETVPSIVADLPGIFDHVTTSLGYVPAASMEIKVYADAGALVANTLLSLPDIGGWNEPGEALKLRLDPENPSSAPAIAHEFTHFVVFDRAGTHRSLMPWWLDEGLATYVAEAYESPERGEQRLASVIEWQAADELAPWASMAVFEETARDLWQFVYPQGYAMVRYVTEEYGAEMRNAWLAAMATEKVIDDATPAILGVTFKKLDANFRRWLASQHR
jgi:hypothetical protein